MVPLAVDWALWLCTVFPLAVVVQGLVGPAFRPGIRFFPRPLTSQRGMVLVLVALGFALGVALGSPAGVVFVAAATLALGVQHGGPKVWARHRVAGVGFRPLRIEAVEREGSAVVLVLERGYRLVVPDTPGNRRFLGSLEEVDDGR